jgi:acyl-coenzyme A synthetase/AMP-(fatty) acid ligase
VEHHDREPDATALIWHERHISYGELYRMALRQHERIARLDADRQTPLGLLVTKSPEAIALLLACLLDDRAFLLPAAALPARTLRSLFDEAGCIQVLTPDDLQVSAHPVRDVQMRPGTTFLLTTSGSTGRPKIVPLQADAVGRFITWAAGQFDIGPRRTVLSYAPLNFDLSLLDVWTTLAAGGRVVLCDPTYSASARYLCQLLAQHEIHVVQAVPVFYRLLIDAAGGRRFRHVEHVVGTGDHLPGRDLAALPLLFPRARLWNLYGCTETNDSFLHEFDPTALPDGPAPLGAPLPDVRAVVVGVDGAELNGPGAGELYVSTPFQTDDYLGGSARTGRFGPHPTQPDGWRYYRTGDLVERDDDGQLLLRGRADSQVKVRGMRIDLQEMERVLSAHPMVAEAAVVAVPDDIGGHALLAVVRRVPGSDLNSLVLRGHCAQSIATGAIPPTIRIRDDPLPRTSTGKIDRTLITACL